MGNCTGIHGSVHAKTSIIEVNDPFKASRSSTNALKPWKLVTHLSQKTQPCLFDYDDHEISKFRTQVDKSGKYISTSKGIQVLTSEGNSLEALRDPNIEMALDVKLTDETLEIKAPQNGKELWRVLRNTTANRCNHGSLHEKDVIKLGNFHCYVKKVQVLDSSPNDKSSSLSSQEMIYHSDVDDDTDHMKDISQNLKNCTSEQPHFIQMKINSPLSSDEKLNRICRICLGDENTSADPLISPCKCSGSMKWIHLECLRKWLINKIEIVEDEVIRIYAWKDLNCELCKSSLKTDLMNEDSQIQLLDMKPNKNSYISFVSLDPDEQQKYYLFILNLDKQDEINIGRFTECDLRINEISVSRYHSKIYKKGNKVYIEDLQSKFGTLIKIPEQGLILDRHQKGTVALQSGRSFVQISNI